MHRNDHSTATAENLFTEGNPVLSVPATYVTAAWANDVQENLAQAIEGAGIALVKGEYTQLLDAIKAIKENGTNVFNLANNAADADITNLTFDPAVIKSVVIEWDVHRKDDDTEIIGTGRVSFHWKSGSGEWVMLLSDNSSDGDHGLTFGMDVDEVDDILQVVYSTSNFVGANHSSKLRYKVQRFTV